MLTKLIGKYPIIGQFVRFAMIGGLNTGIDLIILNILTIATGLKEGVAFAIFKGISFVAAATFSYFMNKHWAFKDTSKSQEVRKFSQFFIVSIVGALINVGTASLVVNVIKPALGGTLVIPLNDQLWVNVAALSGTAIGLIWNFLGYKFIVFKK